MKFSTALIIGASAALTSATGPDYDPETGKWTCHVPDAVYCAGDSLKTNIIIRCTGLVGQPGNCNDNLAGQPPLGVGFSLCYAPELHKAACEKNCIVYGGSGNLEGTFPLPADVCTPTTPPTNTTTTEPEPTATTTTEPEPTGTTTTEPEPTTTTTEPEPTATTTEPEPTATTTEPEPTATTTEPEPTATTSEEPEPTTTTTIIEPPHTDEPTVVPPPTITVTITECPTTPIPPATITTLTHTNGTGTAAPTGGHTTNTPVGPSSTITPPIPGAGVKNAASLGMVVFGAVVAFVV